MSGMFSVTERGVQRLRGFGLSLAAAALLVACGGESESLSAEESGDSREQALGVVGTSKAVPGTWSGRMPKQLPMNLRFSGTVAVGAPIRGVVVSAKCGNVTAKSAPTNQYGDYQLNLIAALPCTLEATDPITGFVFRSIATTDGTANISPLTEALYMFADGRPENLSAARTSLSSLMSSIRNPLIGDPVTVKFVADETGHDLNILNFVKASSVYSTSNNNPYLGITGAVASIGNGECLSLGGPGTTINTPVEVVCPRMSVQTRFREVLSPEDAKLAHAVLDAIAEEFDSVTWPIIKATYSGGLEAAGLSEGMEELVKRAFYYATAEQIARMSKKQLVAFGISGTRKSVVKAFTDASRIRLVDIINRGGVKGVLNIGEFLSNLLVGAAVDAITDSVLEGVLSNQQGALSFEEIGSAVRFGLFAYALDAGSSAAIGCTVAPPACGLIAIGGATTSWVVKDFQLLYQIRNVKRDMSASATYSAVSNSLQNQIVQYSQSNKVILLDWAKSNRIANVHPYSYLELSLYEALDDVSTIIYDAEKDAICPGVIYDSKCGKRLDSATYDQVIYRQNQRLNRIGKQYKDKLMYCEQAIAAEGEVGVSKCMNLIGVSPAAPLSCPSGFVLRNGECKDQSLVPLSVSLKSTGTGLSGEKLSVGQVDPYWKVVAGPGINSPRSAVVSRVNPAYYVTPAAAWVWLAADASGAINSYYEFEQEFDLGSADPNAVMLTGKWSADNYGSVFINGQPATGSGRLILPQGDNNNLPTANSFTITSGFKSGLNKISFRVIDTGNPGGLLVSELNVVPK